MAARRKKSRKQSKAGQKARARARTAMQLARQEKCFELSVLGGKTTREIAVELKIGRSTVIADLHAEQARRRDENAERRDFESARAIGFYERVITRAMKRADIADTLRESLINPRDDEKDEEGEDKRKDVQWISDRSLETAMRARERIDKLLGLDAPMKLELDATKTMTDEELRAEREALRAKQAARESIKTEDI